MTILKFIALFKGSSEIEIIKEELAALAEQIILSGSIHKNIYNKDPSPKSGRGWQLVCYFRGNGILSDRGGQPHDTGTLNHIKVVNVEEINGEIRHFVEKPISEQNIDVTGVIDWERRFDHMQQHSGQHILSAAFEELFGYRTVSFHLGKEVLTIDLDIEELSEQKAMEAEKLANQIILENRPIETKWVTERELSKYPLRKQPSVTENIRLVIIPDFDYNGCGGTHPHSTGQVGAIKILDWERQRKRIRVQFVCGNRVLKQLGKKQKVIRELNALLNASEEEIITAASRLLDHAKETEKSLEEARENLLHYEAKELLEKANLKSN